MKTKYLTKITAEPGRQELFITRDFDAPRELVFKAFTTPKLIEQWIGGGGDELTMKIDYMNLKTCGSYRYILTDPQGNGFAFNGVVHDAAKPDRLIQTFEFEGLPERGHVMLECTSFDELPDEKTRVHVHCIYMSVEDRDGMIHAGMEHGLVSSHNRLDEVLAKILPVKTIM